jgi:DnaJ-class molecular chaperone
MKNYYQILEVKTTATSAEIKKSYRLLSKRYHPDVNSNIDSEENFKKISEAYETLSDDKKRIKYNLENYIFQPITYAPPKKVHQNDTFTTDNQTGINLLIITAIRIFFPNK